MFSCHNKLLFLQIPKTPPVGTGSPTNPFIIPQNTQRHDHDEKKNSYKQKQNNHLTQEKLDESAE